MRVKPKVCLIDEDPQVQLGWEKALNKEASLEYYKDCQELLDAAGNDASLLHSFDCVIVSRYFKQTGVDVCESPLIAELRNQGVGAIFLNWQGYLTKEEIDSKFDGRLFNRYGVRWQTLRSRIQKIRNKKAPLTRVSKADEPAAPKASPSKVSLPSQMFQSKPQRCQDLLRSMARKAVGRHKEKLEYYAAHDSKEGIALLEAIYNRLLTATDSSMNCPSRYINTSPVVAKNILKEALYGS